MAEKPRGSNGRKPRGIVAQFKAFSPKVEVYGQVVVAVLDVMGAFRPLALTILRSNGIADPQPERWYSQQAWLDAFATIAEQIGPNTIYQLARQIPTTAPMPPSKR